MKPILIAVAGGSASGKTTIVDEIITRLAHDDVTVIKHDDYYNDRSDLTFEERTKINYDHIDSLDNELLIKHLKMLLNNEQIDKPTYDFIEHNRSNITEVIKPTKVIILEGILVLTDSLIRQLADIKIFVEADDDLRFIRRLDRDIKTRGRSVETVIQQYLKTVRPMHHLFVRPSKRYADIIIPNEVHNNVAIDMIITKIKDVLNKHI